MSDSKIRTFTVFTFLLCLNACRISSDVSEGGALIRGDGEIYCPSSQKCETEVTDTSFDETYSAVPNEGYGFMHWGDGLCAQSTTPCRLFTTGFDSSPFLMSILDSDRSFDLDPLFAPILQGVACSDGSVPDTFQDFQETSQMLRFFRDVDSCSFTASGDNSPFDGVAYYLFSAGQIPVDDGLREIGRLRAGDLILFFKLTDASEALLLGQENMLVLYIDSDNDSKTGLSLHGTMGADYRAHVKIDRFVPGFLSSWSEADNRWYSVPDEDYDNKLASYAGSIELGWQAVIFTGTGSQSIGVPRRAVLRVEKKPDGCVICNNKPKILATENIVDN